MMALSELRAIAPEREKITVCEKIIYHLGDYVSAKIGEYGTPFAMTQDGIAVACGISRAHASIELKKLIMKELVETKKTHVPGCKTVRSVYFLSENGINDFKKLREIFGIDSKEILFPQNGEEKGIRNPDLDWCYRKVLKCALDLHKLRDQQKPELEGVETELLDVVKTLCRN